MREIILHKFNRIDDLNCDPNFSDVMDKINIAYSHLVGFGRDTFKPISNNHIVVAKSEKDGNTVGFVVWLATPNFVARTSTAFVGLSWVDPEYRNIGVYKAMLKLVETVAKNEFHCTKLQLAVAGNNDLSIAVHDSIFGVPEVIVYSKPITS